MNILVCIKEVPAGDMQICIDDTGRWIEAGSRQPGTRQTGLPDYRIANLVRDAELMPRVQIVAERILREAPDTGAAIMRRWLGDASRYGKV